MRPSSIRFTVPEPVETLVIGLGAALAVTIVAVLALLGVITRRTSNRADARVADVVGGLEERMEALARELTDTVRRAEEEVSRNRFLGRIGTTMDLDDVLEATLEAASSLPHVDAALVRLDAAELEQPTVASVEIGRAHV